MFQTETILHVAKKKNTATDQDLTSLCDHAFVALQKNKQISGISSKKLQQFLNALYFRTLLLVVSQKKRLHQSFHSTWFRI